VLAKAITIAPNATGTKMPVQIATVPCERKDYGFGVVFVLDAEIMTVAILIAVFHLSSIVELRSALYGVDFVTSAFERRH